MRREGVRPPPVFMPFRIEIKGQCVVSDDTLRLHAKLNAEYPKAEPQNPHGRKLAVVGGGPLVVDDLPELSQWEGDIWAINYTYRWLAKHGIRSTFVTIDPCEFHGLDVDDALVATSCHPSLFKQIRKVKTFDLIETDPRGMPGGTFTATRIPSIALHQGYLDVSFFGFEGSHGSQTHVDRNETVDMLLVVCAGGEEFIVEPSLLSQCEQFMEIFQKFGVIYKNRSRGLLKAMIENPDTWEIVAVSETMKKHLELVNGAQGIYDNRYEVKA